MPHGGIPIPRAVPAAASAAQMSASPPMPTSPYPYQAVPSVPRGGGVPATKKRGLPGIITTLFIIIVCVFVGGGIYYFATRAETPSQPISTADVTPPSIQSGPISSTTETGAIITWETDEPTTGKVDYGKTETYGSETAEDTSLSTSHSVTLTRLDPNTTYYFKIISKDAAGNEITAKGDLTTLATADETPPTISGVSVSNITESSAIITWATNEDATSQVQYGKTETYGSSTTPDTNLTTNHNVTLNGLSDNTTYYFKVISKDASGNEATLADNQQFTTKSIIPVGYEEGNLAPEFTLNDLNDNEVNLSDFRGKIVVVNFWATWCEPCKDELPFFQAISDNWTILAINKKEGEGAVFSFISGEEYTFTVLLDSAGEVNTLYNVDTLPTTFFIDAEGIIREIKEGSFSSQTEIEDILDSL
jgi:peroxiredoxin